MNTYEYAPSLGRSRQGKVQVDEVLEALDDEPAADAADAADAMAIPRRRFKSAALGEGWAPWRREKVTVGGWCLVCWWMLVAKKVDHYGYESRHVKSKRGWRFVSILPKTHLFIVRMMARVPAFWSKAIYGSMSDVDWWIRIQ